MNGVGRLTGASDVQHSLSWTYDALGRTLTKAQAVGSVGKTVTYGYNAAGQLSSVTTPRGYVIGYQYTNNRISTVSVNGMYMVDEVQYEPFGPAKSWKWGNGSQTVRAHDLDGRPTGISSGGDVTLGYDNASRIVSATDQQDSARSWSYGYDTLDRLTSANRTSLSQGWTYDLNGNRLTETGAAASTYTVSATSNRLDSVTGVVTRSSTYLASGQLSGDGARTFGYNDAGRLTSVSGAGSGTYVYNALGQRVKKTTPAGTTYFIYDEAGHLLGEYDAAGNLIQELVWMDDTLVLTLRPSVCGLAIFYIHTDHLGTPRKITARSTPDIVWRWDSDPFGTTAPNEDPDGNGTGFVFNLRFPGQYWDGESGTSYNYFRDYDPATGRYLESDPVGLRGGINTYAYVGSDPVVNIDPLGLEYGAAYRAELRHDGWKGPPPPGSAGLVRPETKSYLCKLIELCHGDMRCVWKRANDARKSDLRNRSWYNDTWREAENWAYTAGWDNWATTASFINLHELLKFQKYVFPTIHTTYPSMDAWSAGLGGRAHYGQTPEQLKEWCNGCSLH